jgi:phosphoribosylformimino-5-aminoimidazole carboxamide ribotide isomerase
VDSGPKTQDPRPTTADLRPSLLDLYPAIDIRNGRVVRLTQGEPTRQTVYGNEPRAIAEQFAERGARWIHLVDLDRAFGEGDNLSLIADLVGRLAGRVRVQLGGGLRSLDRVREGLDLGVARLVLGTAAALDQNFVPAAVELAGSPRLAVGVDGREGLVAVRGWTETSSVRVQDLAQRAVRDGITTLIYTDVTRDGTMRGPDIAGALELQLTGARVIASGGISSVDDVRAICATGLAGVIVGRALYEGQIELREALEAAGCASFS